MTLYYVCLATALGDAMQKPWIENFMEEIFKISTFDNNFSHPQIATHISKLRCDIFFQVKSSCSMGCYTQSFEYDGVQTTVIQMVTKFVWSFCDDLVAAVEIAFKRII